MTDLEDATERLDTAMERYFHNEAKAMAEAINGGDWDKDYTSAQKAGWILKTKWAFWRYAK